MIVYNAWSGHPWLITCCLQFCRQNLWVNVTDDQLKVFPSLPWLWEAYSRENLPGDNNVKPWGVSTLKRPSSWELSCVFWGLGQTLIARTVACANCTMGAKEVLPREISVQRRHCWDQPKGNHWLLEPDTIILIREQWNQGKTLNL